MTHLRTTVFFFFCGSTAASIGVFVAKVGIQPAIDLLPSAWPLLLSWACTGALFILGLWPMLTSAPQPSPYPTRVPRPEPMVPPAPSLQSPYRKAIEREAASPGPPEDRMERMYVEAYIDGAKAERETILNEARAIRDRIGHPEANIGSGARAIVKAIEDRDTFSAVPTAGPPAKYSA